MPSVPVMTSTSPSRPASATAPRPPGPERAQRVRLVDQDPRVVAVGELDDLRQRRDVAVHAEHAVGGDQRRAAVALAQRPREVLGVGVAIGDDLRAREAAAVDDRAVAELVVQDDLAAPGQGGDHAQVGHRAGPEEQRRPVPGEGREALLEPAVERHRPARHARRARSDAPAHRRVRGRLAHLRMVRQTERVPGAQQQHRPPVEHHARSLRSGDHPHALVQTELIQLVQAVLEIQHPRSSLGRLRPGCSRGLWREGTARGGRLSGRASAVGASR